MCQIKEGDTIAVIGSGPVGLCSMICAKYMGAKTIIAIDINENRLSFAKKQNLADIALNPQKCDIEKEIKSYTSGRGADGVIECAGGDNTFDMAWKIARPNSVVAVVAMYEKDQIIPLPRMYGKNLIFKTGGVDAIHCKKLIDLISERKINTDFLITSTFSLDDILKAYDLFKDKEANCLKIAVKK